MHNKWRPAFQRSSSASKPVPGPNAPLDLDFSQIVISSLSDSDWSLQQPHPPSPSTEKPRSLQNTREYDFIRPHLSQPSFDYAEYLAAEWNCPLHEVLLSLGWMTEETYCHALSTHLNISYLGREIIEELLLPEQCSPISILPEPALGMMSNNGEDIIVLNGCAVRPEKLGEIINVSGENPGRLTLTTQLTMREALRSQNRVTVLNRAKDHLANFAPSLSASTGMWPAQALNTAILMGMIAGAFAMTPRLTLTFILALLTLPFLVIVILRLATIFVIFFRNPEKLNNASTVQNTPPKDAELPVYSILVPLFKEHEVLPDLIEALKMLDYPATKLDIKIILESIDVETIEIAKALKLPGNFDIIIVPEGGPRTKPKALNYALQYAKGEFVVIYDAEDEPDPGQLRAALEMFAANGPETACIQARLNIYNFRENWFTRQFTIEYTSLFDGLLPAFESLHLPIMLGGTSNHFRASILRKIGAWDPYNVTEDADLGIRLLRQGYKCRILPSTTYEEAPTRFMPWLQQRTRWLKGWLQTFLVHTRNTARLRRDIGTWRYIGFQAILGGAILSALIHPIFYIGLTIELLTGDLATKPTNLVGNTLWHAALINLSCGYLAAILLAWVTLIRRGISSLLFHTLTMPLYWLLISIAAYRAIFQLIWNPFLWEKTHHTSSEYRQNKAQNIALGPK